MLGIRDIVSAKIDETVGVKTLEGVCIDSICSGTSCTFGVRRRDDKACKACTTLKSTFTDSVHTGECKSLDILTTLECTGTDLGNGLRNEYRTQVLKTGESVLGKSSIGNLRKVESFYRLEFFAKCFECLFSHFSGNCEFGELLHLLFLHILEF